MEKVFCHRCLEDIPADKRAFIHRGLMTTVCRSCYLHLKDKYPDVAEKYVIYIRDDQDLEDWLQTNLQEYTYKERKVLYKLLRAEFEESQIEISEEVVVDNNKEVVSTQNGERC